MPRGRLLDRKVWKLRPRQTWAKHIGFFRNLICQGPVVADNYDPVAQILQFLTLPLVGFALC